MAVGDKKDKDRIAEVLEHKNHGGQDTYGKTPNINGFETTNECYEISFLINNVKVEAMVDSGSTVNCISTELVDKLLLANPSKDNNDVEIHSLGDIYSINSSIAKDNSNVKYYTRLKLTFKNPKDEKDLWKEQVDAIMFGKLDRYEMLVGVPFLKKYGNMFDWPTGNFYPFPEKK